MHARTRTTTRRKVRFAALLACVMVTSSSLAGAGLNTPGIRVPGGFKVAARARLAEGVYRYTITSKRPPQRIHVVRAPVGSGATLRLALSRGRIAGPSPRLSRTSVMCKAARCLAGVNGSFFRNRSGTPLGAVVMNGEPVQSSRSPREQLLVAPDGSMRIGKLRLPTSLIARYPKQIKVADLTATVDGLDEERVLVVNGVNVYRKPDQTILYTSRYGPRTPRDNRGVELLARIVEPAGRLQVNRPTIVRPYALRWQGNSPVKSNTVVLSGRGDGADQLVALWRDISSGKAREKLTLTVGTSTPTSQSLAGRPVLVKNGKIQKVGDDSLARSRSPRTIMGWNADGDVLLVTIDGRQRGARGMTLAEAARFARRLGMVGALNLDGGGSTTYAERGKLRNVPSDALVIRGGKVVRTSATYRWDRVRRHVERPVSTAVLLVPA